MASMRCSAIYTRMSLCMLNLKYQLTVAVTCFQISNAISDKSLQFITLSARFPFLVLLFLVLSHFFAYAIWFLFETVETVDFLHKRK